MHLAIDHCGDSFLHYAPLKKVSVSVNAAKDVGPSLYLKHKLLMRPKGYFTVEHQQT